MKGKSRGSSVEREYSDEEIWQKLNELYGKENCIQLGQHYYIVCKNDTYYLMQASIPEMVDMPKVLKLTKVISIKEEEDGSISAKIKERTKKIFVTALKSEIIKELPQWI